MASRPKQHFQTALFDDLFRRVEVIHQRQDEIRLSLSAYAYSYPGASENDLKVARDLYEHALNLYHASSPQQERRYRKHFLAVRIAGAVEKNQSIMDQRVLQNLLYDGTGPDQSNSFVSPEGPRKSHSLLYDVNTYIILNKLLKGNHYLLPLQLAFNHWSDQVKQETRNAPRKDLLQSGEDKLRIDKMVSFVANSSPTENPELYTTLTERLVKEIDASLGIDQTALNAGDMSIGRLPLKDFRKYSSAMQHHQLAGQNLGFLHLRVHFATMLQDAYRYKWQNSGYKANRSDPDNPDVVYHCALQAGFTSSFYDFSVPDPVFEDLIEAAESLYEKLEHNDFSIRPEEAEARLQDTARSFPAFQKDVSSTLNPS